MRLLTGLIAGSVIFNCCSPVNKGIKSSPNPVVAHRGAWKTNHLPENSIASLKQAIVLYCTGSEFDVRMTADDSLVINHDPAFNGLVIEKTNYAALITHKLSNGEKLPTLREYLSAGVENNLSTTLVVEIKPSDISKKRGKASAIKTVDLIRELHAEKKVQYISFDYDILLQVEQLDKTATTQYLNGDKSPDQLETDGIDGADYHFSVFQKNPAWINDCKKKHLIVNAWTVNKAEDIQWLLDNDVNFITTNEPELAMSLYKQSAK